MGNDIWILVAYDRQDVDSVTFEMLDEGRKIASRLSSCLVAVVLGHPVPDIGRALASHGADLVYAVDHELLADYTTDAYACALVALIRDRGPFLVLLPATANGRDLAPRLAARLGAGLASDCCMVKLNADGTIEATRPTHRDKVYTTVVLTSHPPFLATIRPGAIGLATPDSSRQVDVENVTVRIDPADVLTKVLATTKVDPATVDITEADIIVSGGRGLGSAASWQLVTELAGALGAAVGGSRMALDAGWIPRERLVGQTGKSVAPKLYFALGISGAKEHLLGTRDAQSCLAINIDPGAPILKMADKAIIADAKELVPVLIDRLRRLKSLGAG